MLVVMSKNSPSNVVELDLCMSLYEAEGQGEIENSDNVKIMSI